MRSLILYHTLGCHLCDLAKKQVEPLLAEYDLCLVEIDIADDDILVEKYGVRIPVIQLQGTVALAEHESTSKYDLGWPFDTAGVHSWLLKNI
ncbi:MAG: hypothetical protein ACI8VC_000823 [Candidatus Endobugula sp.]|jgi:hypothetical protein